MATLNETVLSLRPGRVNMQQSPDISMMNRSNRSTRKTKQSQRPSKDDRMLEDVDNFIKQIYMEPSKVQEEGSKIITNNYEPLGSYSWKDVEHPTIYVPGLPPKLTLPILPIQLQRDNLTRSKPRSPAAAVDPLFETLLHQNPNLDMSHIEVVTDSNTLRNFLTFASNGPGKWRVDVDMIQNTMFFNQWEEFRLMMINGHQDSGFGHAFEDSLTAKESRLDTLYYERIARYELGGLNCLVRFEADAYLYTNGNTEKEERVPISYLDPPAPKPSRPVLRPPHKLVHVVSRGHYVDPDLIVEIKSCSKDKINTSKALPQLWFSQTKHMCIGYHKEGLVTEKPEIKDMTEELQRWEARSQDSVQNMIRIIREIRAIARIARKCVVICNMVEGVKCLSVYGRKGGDMAIRPEVVKRCWRNVGEA